SADEAVRSRADARLTRVGLGAGVAIVARTSVRLRRAGTGAAQRIADPGCVALVGRRARDGAGTPARTCLTGVRVRARIPVVARGAVRLRRVGARAGRGVAGARIVARV